MATTHAAAGVLLAAPLLVLAPEHAPAGALAALAGGVFPDLDLFGGRHRRTLHYPIYYWLLGLPALAIAAWRPGPATVAVALFAVSAAVHSGSDALGAGDEERPWEGTSERAVYLHPAGRWLRPRRWVPYDGSPRDLLVLTALTLPGLLLFDGVVRALLLASLTVSAGYTAFRKRMPPWMR